MWPCRAGRPQQNGRQFILKRRTLLAGSTAVLAAPAVARARSERLLSFIPQNDPTVLDPIWTTAYVTRNHAFMIFDTLYGVDSAFTPQPQMVAGHTVEHDGRRWTLTLRDGLAWHDGERVLARDCVASIARWSRRDPFGQMLMACTDELSAGDDRTIVFQLKKPFPLLPYALGKLSNFCAMMPERLAKTDPFKPITEMIGSGPFKWNAKERVVGSLAVYDRNPEYKPRESGTPEWTAGPKVVHFDRVEWHVIQDPSTAVAAMQNKEMDWWEDPTNDLLQVLSQSTQVRIINPTGTVLGMRFNQLWPPFDNAAIRHAVLKGTDQRQFAQAIAGSDPTMWHVPAGIFPPGTPMATTEGLDVFAGPRDYAAVKKEIQAAGYKGEKVILLVPTSFPALKAEGEVAADQLRKMGFNIDYQAMDWGTLVQRRAKMAQPDQGGWNVFNTAWSAFDQTNPVGNFFLRGNGKQAMFGWPTAPKIEALIQRWVDAPNLGTEKKVAIELQLQALEDVPYVPLGQIFFATSFQHDIIGVLQGYGPIFWNVRRT